MKLNVQVLIMFSFVCLLFTACAPSASTVPATVESPTAIPTPEPTTIPPVTLWIMPELPAAFQHQENVPSEWQLVQDKAQASVLLQAGNTQPVVSQWVFVLAAPFYTISDGTDSESLKTLWGSANPQHSDVTDLWMDENTLALFKSIWGNPGQAVKTAAPDQLLNAASQNNTSWALLPFEQINPLWKVLKIDEQSPFYKTFDPAKYALTIPVSLEFTSATPQSESDTFIASLPPANRDPDKLAEVDLTGVTALVRGTGNMMEHYGLEYPASDDVHSLLTSADIAHVSNEIPFAERCPKPAYDTNDLVFCSCPEYIKLLEYIGTDVVELTGDHFADWGPEAMLYTLDMYKQRGWKYYGGGANIEEAKSPVKFEVNGNKIAFLGCNGKEPGYATASETNPGAYHCDLEEMSDTIQNLKQEGYMTIFTFQHQEYYEYAAKPAVQLDFQTVSDAGAVVVSGSQAHQPQAIELRNGNFIHYGLGNLFFDQINYYGLDTNAPNQAFIDRHFFYDGKYMGVELVSIQFIDLARSRFTTPEERKILLETIFAVSH